MSNIVWQDPPTDRRPATQWASVREALISRPETWALVKTAGYSGARGNVARMLGPGFEITLRKRDGAPVWDVYARFIGEG